MSRTHYIGYGTKVFYKSKLRECNCGGKDETLMTKLQTVEKGEMLEWSGRRLDRGQ